MFRNYEEYDTDLNTLMRKNRLSLKEYEAEDLSDRSDEAPNTDLEQLRKTSIY